MAKNRMCATAAAILGLNGKPKQNETREPAVVRPGTPEYEEREKRALRESKTLACRAFAMGAVAIGANPGSH